MEYRYSATANDGRITSQRNHITGEDVQYQYDTLARLTRAETTQTGGTQWGQQFGYDGFGNLLSKTVTKGSAPMMNLSVDGLTNRITTAGFVYDAAGNMTQMPYSSSSQTLDYDAFGRVTTVTNSDGVQTYLYNWRGQRTQVTKGGQTDHFFYLPDGRLLGRYRQAAGFVTDGTNTSGAQVWLEQELFFYFGGQLVARRGAFGSAMARITRDRLGSVGDGSAHHPYGEDRTAAANDQFKFATYWRDGQSGLDYAQQRYHGPGLGRFTSVDPEDGSATTNYPDSWNRYAYVLNDPISFVDENGQSAIAANGCMDGLKRPAQAGASVNFSCPTFSTTVTAMSPSSWTPGYTYGPGAMPGSIFNAHRPPVPTGPPPGTPTGWQSSSSLYSQCYQAAEKVKQQRLSHIPEPIDMHKFVSNFFLEKSPQLLVAYLWHGGAGDGAALAVVAAYGHLFLQAHFEFYLARSRRIEAHPDWTEAAAWSLRNSISRDWLDDIAACKRHFLP